ncbi:M48 family metallopeptidase [Sediminibacterium goheungense]|uniref:Peptidase M48-like protein n=1 Tax=Sediminibacterium goheungense TaxID=1086393 RepID=A0A4R6IYZ1_9BACT|nr:M48 family metallopeptidase [Sediminibacterium goheungense]TDO27085.1 peptidase M48-like protein [Sediminibacterium goheungense]
MSEYPQILFFDAYKASPREVYVELTHGKIYVSNTDDYDTVLVFDITAASVVEADRRLFIFFNKGRAPYLSIDADHPSYPELKKAIHPDRKTWFGKFFRLKWPVLVAILLSIFVGIYFIMARVIPAAALKIISVQQEAEIGNSFYRSLMASEKIDTAATRIVNDFAGQLHLSDKYQITITVIKENELNAYALPGGHIVLYSGILKVIDDPDMLVALLGHEASHINKRHSLQSILSSMSMSLLRSMILSGFGDVGSIVLEHAGMFEQLRYSRRLEREADREGMDLMIRNRISPVGMKKLMLQLQAADHDLPGIFSFMSTHPMSEERIKTADAFITAHKSATFAASQELIESWRQLKAKK